MVESAMDRGETAARADLVVETVGRVASVGPGTAQVRDLPGTMSDELLLFEDGSRGLAFDIDQVLVGVVLLDRAPDLASGHRVRRTGRVLDVGVGRSLLGRSVDALGRPLDGLGPVDTDASRPVESQAPEIMDRLPVTKPLQTGIKAVDALIPIGRGQRELVMGDRQTGKTAVCLDAILNQAETGVVSIYCGIGKRASAMARVLTALEDGQAMNRCVVLTATEDDPPGLQFIAPYSAMAMAEEFASMGLDVLLVLDDLTRHARAYRELSLLLRRPPGREAFPGDIFYIHSRLLERSTRLRTELGGGSITCLPVVETEAGNLSAYIPTNLISITDGQVYLSPVLFRKGILPAVDIGRSVSRVGGKAQLPAYRAVAGDLRLAYAQFEELEAFSRFGTRLDAETKKSIHRGQRVREILRQSQYQPLPVWHQISVLVAVNSGIFDSLELDAIQEASRAVADLVHREARDLCQAVESGERLQDEDLERLKSLAGQAVADLKPQPESPTPKRPD
ncbi:MAG: F0F1 ATP synthase subunit alpha [Deltaproteobacteria bacterium]|nr:F0F1 ATP synthase subunit alpha [Deltaproteobacteria bacterium]